MMKMHLLFIFLVISLLLTACGLSGPAKIEIIGAKVLEAKVSPVTAGDLNFACICDTRSGDTTSPVFLTIRNRGGEADRLLKVETEGTVQVVLRETSDAQDLISSFPIETVEIPPCARVEFGQRQYAMLLTGLRDDLVTGQTLRLTLYFEKSGPVIVDAAIIPRK